MTDLGNLGQTSFAFSVNSKGQVVGHSLIDDVTQHAFLWEKGGPMIDLNSVIPSGSSLLLLDAFAINERGEIAGMGVPPGCDSEDECGHAFVLVPVGHEDAEDTASLTQDARTIVASNRKAWRQRRRTATELVVPRRARLAHR
jgi:probable HAF family extracellular repeat protein